jgi:hypothetical protein
MKTANANMNKSFIPSKSVEVLTLIYRPSHHESSPSSVTFSQRLRMAQAIDLQVLNSLYQILIAIASRRASGHGAFVCSPSAQLVLTYAANRALRREVAARLSRVVSEAYGVARAGSMRRPPTNSE